MTSIIPTSIFLALTGYHDARISAAVLVIGLTALIGIYDDLRGVRQKYKVLLLFLATTPLAWALADANIHSIYIPYLEEWVVPWAFFPFMLVPIGVSAAGNLTNMLAGFNGVEAGMGSVALGAVAIAALITGNTLSLLIAVPMFAALIAFLFYNWYPAKGFPGNAGTLVIGSTLACTVIIGRIEIIGVCVLLPHIIDFLMKLLGVIGKSKPFGQRALYGDTTVCPNGVLHPPPYKALSHLLMKIRPMTEKRLVMSLIMCEVFFGVIAILLSILVIQ
jgi:UDP-N-acetylglucosamine--dolichyl-phosphate N-acetylglucosaminephosphotransferase